MKKQQRSHSRLQLSLPPPPPDPSSTWGHNQKAVRSQTGRESSLETNPASTLIGLQNHRKINACCLSHLVLFGDGSPSSDSRVLIKTIFQTGAWGTELWRSNPFYKWGHEGLAQGHTPSKQQDSTRTQAVGFHDLPLQSTLCGEVLSLGERTLSSKEEWTESWYSVQASKSHISAKFFFRVNFETWKISFPPPEKIIQLLSLAQPSKTKNGSKRLNNARIYSENAEI